MRYKGPLEWAHLYNPVHINLVVVEQRSHLRKFTIYDTKCRTTTAKNNGHTELVEGFRSWTKEPYITGGNLKGRYYLKQFHFHWDGNSRFGNEHTLDSLHYPLAAHLVHMRSVPPKLKMALLAADSKASRRSYSPGGLIPHDTSTFFRYIGSLTTQPCSEGVIWTILMEPNYVTNYVNRINSNSRTVFHCYGMVSYSRC
ncbi:unnamed protein product [Heligmosomoides polygyrus]|uniref:carbonic anhydrase n=1 Tax=Heligmosomoides polygyrus TaxID=6339 RepID=A0A183F9K2_HELPZ|nr:unnamed protein product [Heligmosomoides polygyrus]